MGVGFPRAEALGDEYVTLLGSGRGDRITYRELDGVLIYVMTLSP